jgi:hypothetical protein
VLCRFVLPIQSGVAGDAQWAADRIASMPRVGSATTRLLYDQDGHETRYTSAQDSGGQR